MSYLRYLKEVADKIIFIADNEASKSEQDKLKGLVDYIQFQKHGEYDFGSYKRGIQYAEKKGWLKKADELVLCNDSCFCIRSLKHVFEKMAQQRCDFWGLSASNEFRSHLQSFFLVFKRKVFTSKVFKGFIQSVQKQPNALSVVHTYEIPLKSLLNKEGFKDCAYLIPKDTHNPMMYSVECLKKNFPLLKKKLFYGKLHSFDTAHQILKEVENISKKSRVEIIQFFRQNFCIFFPLITPAYRDFTDPIYAFFSRFLYQKKITKSGKVIIKICKIPVYRRKNEAT